MKFYLTPNIKNFFGEKDLEIDDFIEAKEDKLFHIGQGYENRPAKTIYCKICGGNKFYVGQGDWWTGIKCINCGYEICIHSG